MTSNSTRIVIVDEGTITAGLLRERLAQNLSTLRIHWLNIRLTSGHASGTAVSAVGVQEYRGSEAELADKMVDAEVLVVHKAPVSDRVMAAAPHLKLITCARGGPLNVDLAAAQRRGILVVHTPGRAAESAADLTMGLIIALARRLLTTASMVKQQRHRAWAYDARSDLEGMELHGQVVGLIGFGHVARAVARRASAFGMRILVYSPRASDADIARAGGRRESLQRLLEQSGFVSLHARLTAKRRGMLGRQQLSLMRPTAYLINTARADLIDERDLLWALEQRCIAGAALDVLWQEPPPENSPWFRLPQVILTPHIGGKTRQAALRAASMIGDELDRYLRGEPLRCLARAKIGTGDGV